MATDIQSGSANPTVKTTLPRLAGASLLAMLAATAANLGLYYAAGILFPEVTAWSGAGTGQIAGANFVYLLTGAIVFAIIARLSPRPRRHYLILAVAALLLSMAMPISAGFGYGPPGTPPAGAATVVTLSLMHVVSFAVSVPLFIRTLLD